MSISQIVVTCIYVFLRVNQSHVYIGLKRQISSKDLIRMDGTTFNLGIWDNQEPENYECVVIKLLNYKLHDTPCGESHFFLCTG